MSPRESKDLCLVILAAFLLSLAITGCKRAKATEAPTLEVSTQPPEPTPTVVPTFELPGGTLVSWWDGGAMVYVPGGEVVIGDREATEVNDFWIHQTEVTNRMYAQCVAAGACQPPTPDPSYPNHYAKPEYANHPVVSVNWQNAADYCTWMGGELPSEAEWERAARGDSGDPYPWGQQDPNCSRLNFLGCTPSGTTAPVGSYPLGLSPFNVADMAGNVFEWVKEKAVRSSSFLSTAEKVPVTLSFSADPESGRADLGFRCALSDDAVKSPPASPCTTLSYEPIPRQVPSTEPQFSGSPAFSLEPYCRLRDNTYQYGTAVIQFEAGTDVSDLEISSPQGTLNCTPDANDPLRFTCVGSALQPGKAVTIEVCNTPHLRISLSSACPSKIEGLLCTQEGTRIRAKWDQAPQDCCDKILVRLQCDGVDKMSLVLPGSQTEIVIDGCPQPYTTEKVCLSCIDQNGNPGEPACSELPNAPTAIPLPTATPILGPVCPDFYEFNPDTNLCEYRPTGLGRCDSPHVAVPGYGCLPAPQSGNCPVGYFEASYNNQPICVPVGGPRCQGTTCPARCPVGLVLDEARLCCKYPPDVPPVCRAGYVFDSARSACVPGSSVPTGCTSITVMVPECKPEQPGQSGPTGCLVRNPFTGALSCTVPCPASGPNEGPCTP